MRALFVGPCLFLAAGCFGGGGPGNGTVSWDVRGNYALSYGSLTLVLTTDGVARKKTSTGSDVIDFGDFDGQTQHLFDVGAFCARPDVACPFETFTPRVSIDQVDFEQNLPQHAVDVVNDAGVHYGGVVDGTRQEEFLVDLAQTTTNPDCATPAPPVATGRFTHRGETVAAEPSWRTADDAGCTPSPLDGGNSDCSLEEAINGIVWPADAPVDGIAGGHLATTWLAVCGIAGLTAGATLSIATDFAASRTGDYAPSSPADLSAEADAGEDAATGD